jgi:hypothetical protein
VGGWCFQASTGLSGNNGTPKPFQISSIFQSGLSTPPGRPRPLPGPHGPPRGMVHQSLSKLGPFFKVRLCGFWPSPQWGVRTPTGKMWTHRHFARLGGVRLIHEKKKTFQVIWKDFGPTQITNDRKTNTFCVTIGSGVTRFRSKHTSTCFSVNYSLLR